jgi:hypothetical protein
VRLGKNSKQIELIGVERLARTQRGIGGGPASYFCGFDEI